MLLVLVSETLCTAKKLAAAYLLRNEVGELMEFQALLGGSLVHLVLGDVLEHIEELMVD